MRENSNARMTRKEFMAASSRGILGFSLFGRASNLISGSGQVRVTRSSKFRTLGRTGFRVSPVGCGATRTLEPAVLKSALDTGINFIDTGRSYFNGRNEEMIGRVIKEIRSEVVIQTKIPIRMKALGNDLYTPEARDTLKRMLEGSLHESLKALQTDCIDILLLHRPDSTDITRHETVWEFFRKAKQEGKISACGFSAHDNQIELLKDANTHAFYDVIMVPYNHKGSSVHWRSKQYREWDQAALEAELKKAEMNQIGIVAMKTCSGGPYSQDQKSEPTMIGALKWILSHSFISTMAVAMMNLNEVREDVQAMQDSDIDL